jgi:uncharacterized radical SAM superfamily protein
MNQGGRRPQRAIRMTTKTHLDVILLVQVVLLPVPGVQVLGRPQTSQHQVQHRHSRRGMVPDRLANIRSEQPHRRTYVSLALLFPTYTIERRVI